MSDQEIPRSEFSHLVTPSELGRREVVIEIEADGEARAGLARRFGLLDLPALHATVRLAWLRSGKVLRIGGRIRARVVQSCVVTLEPVEYAIDTPFEIRLAPDDGGAEGLDDGAVEDIGSVDEVEPLIGDSLDVGEVVAEELALALEPYPRKPGASHDTGPYLAEIGAKSGGSGRSRAAGANGETPGSSGKRSLHHPDAPGLGQGKIAVSPDVRIALSA